MSWCSNALALVSSFFPVMFLLQLFQGDLDIQLNEPNHHLSICLALSFTLLPVQRIEWFKSFS
jgi:hypothetical protein